MLTFATSSPRRHATAWLRASALACASLLAACGPLHTKIPDLPKDTPADWQARNKAAGGLAPDLDQWWRSFDDPVVNGLIERALKDNLNIQIAGERLQAARAVRHAKRSQFWPNLNFRTQVETAPNSTTGYLVAGFDSSWEFGFFGRDLANKRVNLADENLAIIDDAGMRVTVVAEVARNYVELRAAQSRALVLNDVVTQRQKQVDLAAKRLQLRLGTQLELDRAQVELQQAQNDAGEPAVTVVQAGQALAVLLGVSTPDPALQTAAAQPKLPAIDFRQTPADLVRTRADIRRAEQNVVRAAGELGIARADMWPKFGLFGTFVSSSALTGGDDRVVTYKRNNVTGKIKAEEVSSDFVFIAGPTISIPLVDWGARRKIANAHERALQASVLAYREAVIEGVAEAQTMLAQFEAKSASAESTQKTLELTEHSAQSAQTMQRIGLGDGMETAGANLASIQSRLARNLAVRDRALAYIALYKALGGTIPPMAKDTKHEGLP